jgi:hypothetical protein
MRRSCQTRGEIGKLSLSGVIEEMQAHGWMFRDSYHQLEYHIQEIGQSKGLSLASRGTQRYDPHTRQYTEWSIPHDWHGDRVNFFNEPFYPRFTEDEAKGMVRRIYRGKAPVNLRAMGSSWTDEGPRVRQIRGKFTLHAVC